MKFNSNKLHNFTISANNITNQKEVKVKELLIGMGIGFMVGAIAVKTNKCLADKVEMGVEKGKEIIEDISDEIKTQTAKTKKEKQEG